jgi:hypothetical protein
MLPVSIFQSPKRAFFLLFFALIGVFGIEKQFVFELMEALTLVFSIHP